MKLVFVVIMAGLLILAACSAATGIEISDAWARPAMQGDNGAVYFLLQNHSAGSDELTGVSSEVAQAVEMHESRMEGDVMQMRPVMSLPIKGKESIQFGPGGYHVMLVNLNRELTPGDEIQVTLHFRDNGDLEVTVPVQETQPEDSMNDH